MADIAQIRTPSDRNDAMSPLMKAKAKLQTGQRAYACPYGCAEGRTDEHGYCRHLIGFTNNSEAECKKGLGWYEPMIKGADGRRLVMVRRQPVAKMPNYNYDDEESEDVEEGAPILEKVLPSDILVRITISSRVYRDVAKKKKTEVKA
jgi:hypothetical protein